MQKVEVYDDVYKAERDMNYHIESGWRVHVCTMNRSMTIENVLVVYEK